MKNNAFAPMLWERLQAETRPIVLYGMGDGAEKIYQQCRQHGIAVSDIFASDEYVRGHSFLGFKVCKYADICEKYTDCVILLCFAAFRPELLQKIYGIAERYTLLAPDVPLFGNEIVDAAFLHKNAEKLRTAYALLADDTSRKVFENVLRFKCSGEIALLRDCETDRAEVFQNIIRFSQTESYLDLGAYTGDTLTEFIAQTDNHFSAVIALEPDRKNYKKLAALCETLQDDRITIYNAGAWDSSGRLLFDGRGGRNSHLGTAGYEVPVYAVDELLRGQPVSYIKMDVEGAEAPALRGLARTIRQYTPSLSVSAYHRTADFFELILLLHTLNPNYRIFLRHHPYIPAWEVNLYAVNAE
ncbi:MAG: FkbM family methyltransferase [Clostridia bacterium]|nr:FkbM family methyltransferase [Clostridia bacterium]